MITAYSLLQKVNVLLLHFNITERTFCFGNNKGLIFYIHFYEMHQTIVFNGFFKFSSNVFDVYHYCNLPVILVKKHIVSEWQIVPFDH